jgi:hypothetical protein
VRIQIWVAMAIYALLAIIKREFGLKQSMNEILQILSISLFDKTALNELFLGNENKNKNSDNEKQLRLDIT